MSETLEAQSSESEARPTLKTWSLRAMKSKRRFSGSTKYWSNPCLRQENTVSRILGSGTGNWVSKQNRQHSCVRERASEREKVITCVGYADNQELLYDLVDYRGHLPVGLFGSSHNGRTRARRCLPYVPVRLNREISMLVRAWK